MEVIIQPDRQAASQAAVRMIAHAIRKKPHVVLGLATGGTPLMLYKELIRIHREEELDFSQVTTFNLDEYAGIPQEDPRSYHSFMWENLFSQINIKPENVHIPDGLASDVSASCAAYEQAIVEAGGIDLQLLGIGANGHIGFNEPTSSFASRTRIKTLTKQTVQDNAVFFGGDEALVPRHCITMGIGTIMAARKLILLAFGEGKAGVVAAMVEEPLTAMVPASILQYHPAAKIFIDEAAATALQLSAYYRWVFDAKPTWQYDA
jgi:glucosamine-6-phosphate deaminase